MSDNNSGSNRGFAMGLLAGIAAVSVIALVVILVMTLGKGGDQVNANVNANNAAATPPAAQPAAQAVATEPVKATGVSTFSAKANAEICRLGGKPVVYLFSTTWCPHCSWVKDTFDQLAKEYVDSGKIVAYHWELDTGDNTLTDAVETAVPAEMEKVYNEFNPKGSIPTFVFGCKYFRVGNGYESQQDLKAEAAEFRAAIDDLLK